MRFGEALDLLRDGGLVRRGAWAPGRAIRISPAYSGQIGGRAAFSPPHIEVLVAGRPWGSPWHASSPDLLAEDWEEVA